VYKKVAKKMLKTNPNIVFAKFDATANDLPYMFPPLRVSYSGSRTFLIIAELKSGKKEQ
jgi:hypothetical protein